MRAVGVVVPARDSPQDGGAPSRRPRRLSTHPGALGALHGTLLGTLLVGGGVARGEVPVGGVRSGVGGNSRGRASPEDEDPFDFASAAASFASHLDKHQAALALRFVRGEPLFDREGVPLASAFADPSVAGDVAESLGRVFVLDALANPDRLRCRALGWRGNPGNLLFGVAGTGTGAGERIRTVVAIDQAVPRRPPAHRARADAAAMPGAIETARNHPPSAAATLREALGGADAIEAAGVCAEDVDGALARRFSEGVREAVEKAAKLKGLFDSLATGLYETLRMLFDDMEDMRREAEREAKAAKTQGGRGGRGGQDQGGEDGREGTIGVAGAV